MISKASTLNMDIRVVRPLVTPDSATLVTATETVFAVSTSSTLNVPLVIRPASVSGKVSLSLSAVPTVISGSSFVPATTKL